jgi:hypothetical protein
VQESESELLYDRRFTGHQFVLATNSSRLTTSNVIFQLNTCGHSTYVTSSLTRVSRQRSHSQVRIPRDSRPHFTLSDTRLPQPGRPDPRIYIPQEQGGPVILPGTGFPFHRYDSQDFGGITRPRLQHQDGVYKQITAQITCES